jgi:hypothetical protein
MAVSVHRLSVETDIAVCVHGRAQQSRSRCTQLESSRVQSQEHVTGGRARKSFPIILVARHGQSERRCLNGPSLTSLTDCFRTPLNFVRIMWRAHPQWPCSQFSEVPLAREKSEARVTIQRDRSIAAPDQ